MKSSLDRRLTELISDVEKWGNFNNRYIFQLRKSWSNIKSKFTVSSIESMFRNNDYYHKMKELLIVGGDCDEKEHLLGFYFSLKYLQLHISTRNGLIANRSKSLSRMAESFLQIFQSEMERLSSAFIEYLLIIYMGGKLIPHFIILNVGTTLDLEDIDIGVIIRSECDTELLRKSLAKLNTAMLRRAIRLHFYLSEQLTDTSFFTTVEDYMKIIDQSKRDFIMISELLNARPVCGDMSLYEHLRKNLLEQYFMTFDKPSMHHFEYVGSMVKELNALTKRNYKGSSKIAVKSEGLMILNALITAQKTRFGVDESSVWMIFGKLKELDSTNADNYRKLQKRKRFLEIFRYFYQLIIAQENIVDFSQKELFPYLADIADCLDIKADNQNEYVEKLKRKLHRELKSLREISQQLINQLSVYHRLLRVFGGVYSGKEVTNWIKRIKGNLALEFLNAVRFFAYSHNLVLLLKPIESMENNVLERFVSDLKRIENKEEVVEQFVCLTADTPALFFSLLKIIAKKNRELGKLFFFRICSICQEDIRIHNIVINYLYERIDEFCRVLPWLDIESREELVKSCNTKRTPRAESIIRTVKGLLGSSQFLERRLLVLGKTFPEILRNMDRTKALESSAASILSRIQFVEDHDRKLELLGNYFDIELLRITFVFMRDLNLKDYHRDFSVMMEQYFQCVIDVIINKLRIENFIPEGEFKDKFAFLAVGGAARREGLVPDLDSMFVLSEDDDNLRDFSAQVVARLNREISCRGIMPHQRFAEITGEYAIPVFDLERFLYTDSSERFVDKSEILGSRMIYGGKAVDSMIRHRIIQRLIFNQRSSYLCEMSNEIIQRNEYRGEIDNSVIGDLKEDPGGLRDLNLLLLMFRAYYRLREPSNWKLLNILKVLDKDNKDKYASIKDNMEFLLKLRSLYRLMVANDDAIYFEYSNEVAGKLGYSLEELKKKYVSILSCNSEIIELFRVTMVS